MQELKNAKYQETYLKLIANMKKKLDNLKKEFRDIDISQYYNLVELQNTLKTEYCANSIIKMSDFSCSSINLSKQTKYDILIKYEQFYLSHHNNDCKNLCDKIEEIEKEALSKKKVYDTKKEEIEKLTKLINSTIQKYITNECVCLSDITSCSEYQFYLDGIGKYNPVEKHYIP